MNRRGFTLIEIMVALVVLMIVVVSLGRFAAGFTSSVNLATVRTVATSVASEQLDLIRSDPTYPLPAAWAGTVTGFPGYPTMARRTTLQRITGAAPSRDYTRVTVKVWHPTLRRPGAPLTSLDTINLTSVVARP